MANVNWRPDLEGKPTIYHLIRAGLLQPADEMGMYGSSGIDPQGRLVIENPRTRELHTDDGSEEGAPYDPVKELGITALQQAGFLAEDQSNKAGYRPSEESGSLGTWWEGMKEGGLPMVTTMLAPGLGQALGGGLTGAAGAGAIMGGGRAALTGGDILEGALTGGLSGGAGSVLGDVASSYLPADGIPLGNEFGTAADQFGAIPGASSGGLSGGAGALTDVVPTDPVQYADASGSLGPVTDSPVYDTVSGDSMDDWGLDDEWSWDGSDSLPVDPSLYDGYGVGGAGDAVVGTDSGMYDGSLSDLVKMAKTVGMPILKALGMTDDKDNVDWKKVLAGSGLIAGLVEGKEDKTSTSSITLPEWYTQGSKEALEIAKKYAATPFEEFKGERVAPLSANENQAIEMARTSAGRWEPMVNEGAGMIRGGALPVSQSEIDGYFNPYVAGALDPVARKLNEEAARRDNERRAKAGMVGAFGGSRDVLDRNLIEQNRLQGVSDLYGTGYAKAWDTSLSAVQSDKNRKITAGGALNSTARTGSELTDVDTKRLAATGALERSTRQADNDFSYEQHQQRLKHPLSQIDAYAGALRGNPGSTRTETKPPDSLLQMGAGALGAYSKWFEPTTTKP